MFNNINLTSEESWFLGLFHSDGCLLDNKLIKFEMNDLDVIEKLHNISGGGMISKSKRNTYYYRVPIKKINNSLSLEDLQIIPRKSLTLQYPKVDLIFSDYLRGVIDGDGTFGRYSLQRGFTIKFAIYSGSYDYIISLKNKLLENFNVNLVTRKTKNSPIYSIQKAGASAIDLLDYIYANSVDSLRLNRKYNKYLEIKRLNAEYSIEKLTPKKRKPKTYKNKTSL